MKQSTELRSLSLEEVHKLHYHHGKINPVNSVKYFVPAIVRFRITASMPAIKTFANCRLSIFPREHGVPHSHLEFTDGDRCAVAIETEVILAGEIRPERKLVEALVWAREHRELLHQKWKEITR